MVEIVEIGLKGTRATLQEVTGWSTGCARRDGSCDGRGAMGAGPGTEASKLAHWLRSHLPILP